MSPQQTISSTLTWSPAAEPVTFEGLLAPHLKLLRRWVVSRVEKTEDAEDVIQQTLLLGLRHMGQFRFEASFGTWLCRIAINVIRGRYRSSIYSRTVFTDPKTLESLDLHDPRHCPLTTLQLNERKTAVHDAISKLPDLYRVVVELRDLQGLTLEETASSLRISKAALKSRHHRARSMLAKTLEEKHGPAKVEVRM